MEHFANLTPLFPTLDSCRLLLDQTSLQELGLLNDFLTGTLDLLVLAPI